MTLRCQRCGDEHRALVQFKTGDDSCELHMDGQVVLDLPVSVTGAGVKRR